MTPPAGIVAVIAANPALSSILTSVLACDPKLRARAFDNPVSLNAYMRIVPVGVLVCDLDCEDVFSMLGTLRADPDISAFSALALARGATPGMREATSAAGIAEVLVKPASPGHLHERVTALMARRPAVPAAKPRPRFTGNVVELFPGRALLPA